MNTSFRRPAQGRSINTSLSFLVLLAVALLAAQPAQGATIQIFFEGLDIEYSDGSGAITNVGNPDSVNEVEFVVDGNEVGSVSLASVNMTIPGIPAIASGVSSIVSSNPGGTFSLDLGGGNFLDLDLAAVDVAYLHASSTVEFVAAGSVASIDGQSLPFGLVIGDPVQLSFSTRVNSSSESGGFITSFTASGTGEITGVAVVPEPTSLGLLALGGLLGSMVAARYRLG